MANRMQMLIVFDCPETGLIADIRDYIICSLEKRPMSPYQTEIDKLSNVMVSVPIRLLGTDK